MAFGYKESISQNECPKCGSQDIGYYDSFLEDDYYCYKGKCNKCNTEFKEWYYLSYTSSTYKEN